MIPEVSLFVVCCLQTLVSYRKTTNGFIPILFAVIRLVKSPADIEIYDNSENNKDN